jgi:serine/threonine-protein kinase
MPSLSASPDTDLLYRLRADQSERWRRGERVLVEDYLRQYPQLDQDEGLLLDLVYAEVLLREQGAETPTVEEYVHRFPSHAEALRRQFALHRELHPPPDQPANGAWTPGDWRTVPAGTGPRVPQPALPEVPGYEVLQELGRGGMGVVYKARQGGLNRLVALKMLRWGGLASHQDLARFRTEAEAVARLHHPNVVQVFTFEEHQGQPYYVMELLQSSLAGRLRQGPLPIREAVGLLRQVALAVEAAHQAKVLHRDLKPGNVLLGEDGQARVADFGLAKLLDSDSPQTASEALLGTPSYMAPEQAQGLIRQVGPAADVWALGVILYECLTGTPPFRSESRQQILELVLTREPERPGKARPEVPAELEAVCLKCLHKNPAHRYASAQDLADDLQRWLQGETTRARPPRWWQRRRRALAGGVLLALLALLAGGVPTGPGAGRLLEGTPGNETVGREPGTAEVAPQAGAALAGKRPYVLIGDGAEAKGYRVRLGRYSARVSTTPDGSFALSCGDWCLLELLPKPPVKGYRLRAQVRHEWGAELAEVGLYCAHREFSGPAGPVHYFTTLNYNDVFNERRDIEHINRKLPKGCPPLPLPRGNKVHLIPRIIALGGARGPLWNRRLGGSCPELFQPHAGPFGNWRDLVMEVTPGEVAGWWGKRQLVGRLTAEAVEQNARLDRTMMQKMRPGDRTPGVIDPRFASTGGLGLYVANGVACFRHVVIEVLD